ncbi:MAG: hypothetical protein ACHBN1_27475 [Heteroscytonema crispum UTEX LB 1556]
MKEAGGRRQKAEEKIFSFNAQCPMPNAQCPMTNFYIVVDNE